MSDAKEPAELMTESRREEGRSIVIFRKTVKVFVRRRIERQSLTSTTDRQTV
ncbi:hypothetical protein RSSM_06484 [Rhodopirellula sallentina SM41]|uniref:Uncharacterized protein n=1 Tax=Rhodopirellula sallentina SM41 TaxID=1263870 RepID=M5U809_9BACT|nr:hypothetical protein RSSM_06484 [Rhodopirellula sallentina SM41]